MTGFEGYCRVTRYGGSWGEKGRIRKMGIREMVDWMNKYGYKLARKHHFPDGRIELWYRKEECKTDYLVTVWPH